MIKKPLTKTIVVISVIVLASLILVLVLRKSQNPLEIIKVSQQKLEDIDYIIEYSIKIDTTINDKSISQVFRTVTSKLGADKKTQLYAREIVLLQETIENKEGLFICYYGESLEDLSCLKLDKPINTFPENEVLKKLLESEILDIQTSKKSVLVGSRELNCDNLVYTLDFSKLTAETAKMVLQLVSTSAESNRSIALESIKEFKLTTCFDRITGLPLESSSFINYIASDTKNPISFSQSAAQKATQLDINPFLSENEFVVPENAKLTNVPGGSK